VGQDCILREGL